MILNELKSALDKLLKTKGQDKKDAFKVRSKPECYRKQWGGKSKSKVLWMSL